MKSVVALRHHIKKMAAQSPLDFEGIDLDAVGIYMDLEEWTSIVPIIKTNEIKFKRIIREILKGNYINDLYRKEDDNITAMKFSGKPNSRIYCQEIPGKDGQKKKVVMSRSIYHKGVQANNKEILTIIESIKNIQYDCKEETSEL